MQPFGRASLPAPELREPFGRVAQRFLFPLHVVDKIFPDVVDGFDVIAALLHQRITAVPAEAHERDASFDAQARLLKMLARFGHARAGADGIVNEDDRLSPVYPPFD